MKTQNTILKAINYLSIYANKSKDFNDFKYIGVSQADPLKVSYIKQDKINSLKEYANVNIKGTKQQRKKYFTRTSINKLLSKMFINNESKIMDISQDIDKQLRKDFILNDDLFIENDLKRFYSQELEDYIYSPNGSCMDKKPSTYFEIYENFINTKTQIVGLKVGKVVIARAILWTKTDKKLIDKDTHAKQYYLDRIYISKDFENSHRAYLQTRLFNKVKRALKLNNLDCYSFSHVREYTKSNILNPSNAKGNEVAIFQLLKNKQYPSFKVQINQDTFHGLEHYPYLDSFRWGEELSQNYSFDMDEDNAHIILDSTAGDYTEGNTIVCDCCGERFHEDEVHYSELEEEYLCDDCSTYIEERDSSCRNENAIYNNYTGYYHYSNDLDY